MDPRFLGNSYGVDGLLIAALSGIVDCRFTTVYAYTLLYQRDSERFTVRLYSPYQLVEKKMKQAGINKLCLIK